MGVQVNYDAFAARWDSEDEGPLLKKLVSRFDSSGLTLKTRETELPSKRVDAGKSKVSKMAKRAIDFKD